MSDFLPLYVSVDLETAGSIPERYALLSIGACLIDRPEITFYRELKPDQSNLDPKAYLIHHLDLEALRQTGAAPETALRDFAAWLAQHCPDGYKPVFVAFNAPFDWMFLNIYFHRYLDYNPFGHTALDIKALYMGMSGVSWMETSMKYLGPELGIHEHLTHNALDDAIFQAELFRTIYRDIQSKASLIAESE